MPERTNPAQSERDPSGDSITAHAWRAVNERLKKAETALEQIRDRPVPKHLELRSVVEIEHLKRIARSVVGAP